jgi:hypothetical protein
MAARERPWMKFYPADWRADPMLRVCSIGARGLWIELLSLCHESERYGHLLVNGKQPTDRQIAALAGVDMSELPGLLAELEEQGVFSRDRNGAIYSRRMIRDERKAKEARKHGNEGGNPKLKGGYNKPGFVYLMGPRADGAYKIGISTNPRLRLKKVRAQYRGQDIQLIDAWQCPDMGTLEADLHSKFSEKQSGEWFFLDALDLSKIRGICGTLNGQPQGREKGQPNAHMPEARVQKEDTPKPPSLPADVRSVMEEGGFVSPPADLSLLTEWYAAAKTMFGQTPAQTLEQDILPTVRAVRARLVKAPFRLKVFDAAIREKLAKDEAEIEHLRKVARRNAEPNPEEPQVAAGGLA